MSSREKILEAVRTNQPAPVPLPDIEIFKGSTSNPVREYMDTFIGIGGSAFSVDNVDAVKTLILQQVDRSKRIVTTLPSFSNEFELFSATDDPHSFENVEMAVIKAHLAVCENGTVWLTEEAMGQRIIPFICQHLAVLVDASTIVPTMHEAYAKIGTGKYGFGVFIGGPSKTADIEQALVMGAHGPIAMTVFVVNDK
jgi:L-lactate dehydrogenase complex protein LldG